MDDFTVFLNSAAHGDRRSAEALLPLIYEELRRLASTHMALESANHTLQPTALVHEAWLKMVNDQERTWHNRAYFFAAAATMMRRILVDHARRKKRLKRGGQYQRQDVDILNLAEPLPDDRILLIEDALKQLERVHPDWAQVVVMKYFGGMLTQEVAGILGIGTRSVERYWACARAWLYKKIQKPQ